MNAASILSLTFLLCQIAASILASQSESTNSSTSCPGCRAGQTSSPIPNHSSLDSGITADDVRREILRWEKEKILKQLRRMQDEEALDDVQVESGAGLVRNTRSAAPTGVESNGATGAEDANETWKDERDEEEDVTESSIILGRPVIRNGTTTLQCYDGIHTKWATCIDFINNTNIKWDRYRRAILHFMLRPDIAEASEEKTHTFAVRAINYGRVDDALGNYPRNITVKIVNASKYIEIDVTGQILSRAMAYSSSGTREDKDVIQCIMTLRITCLTCGHLARSAISLDPTRLPFLEIRFKNRQKRQTPSCEMMNDYLIKDTPQMRGCCKVPVDVNFTEINMPYIIFPSSYRTYYCSGRCYHYTTRSYTAILQTVINSKLQRLGYDNRVALCCAPIATSRLEIVFKNESGMVDKSNLQDMVVTSCGC